MARTRSSRRAAAHARRPDPAFRVEPLEGRVVLAAVSWDFGGGDRLWSNPLNWSGDVVPTVDDDVTIDLGPGMDAEMVVADLPVIRVKSLALNETLVVNRGTNFNVDGDFNILEDGGLRINGLANWIKGTWDGDIAVRVHPGGLLNVGASVNPGVGHVTIESGLMNLGRFNWRGGDITLNGTIINAAGKTLDLASPGTISGSGSITNHSLLRRAGDVGSTTTIAVSLTNTDRVYVLQGRLSIGQQGVETTFTDSGRLIALNFNSAIRYFADSTHAQGRLQGDGLHEFAGGSHTFEGSVFMGLDTRFFGGAELIVGEDGMVAKGRVMFDGATITLGGDMLLRELLAPGQQSAIILVDTLIQGEGHVTLETSATIEGTTFNVGLAIEKGATIEDSTFNGSLTIHGKATIQGATFNGDVTTFIADVGGDAANIPGMVIGPGATFTSRGAFALLSGRIDMAADSVFDKAEGGFLVRGTHVGGANPGEGTLVLRQGLTAIQTRFATTTTIAADIEVIATSQSQPGLTVVNGDVVILGGFSPLRIDPETNLLTLHDYDLNVQPGATLQLPQGVESIGTGSSVVLRRPITIPQIMSSLQEVHGELRFSGEGEYAFDSGVIVNHGLVRKGPGSYSVRVTTPIDNREDGAIRANGFRFEIWGFLNEDSEFINHGTIEGDGQLIINVDHGAVQGTMVNLGAMTNLGRTTVRGSFENASDGVLEIRLGKASDPAALTVTRDMVQGGSILLISGTSHGTWAPVAAASFSGEYAFVRFSTFGPQWSYLPSGALQVTY